MNQSLQNIFQNFQLYEPAAQESIASVEKDLQLQFPSEYLLLLSFSDGLEGWLSDKVEITLWPIEKIIEANDYYQTRDSIPGIILIGNSGKDEAIALDLRPNSQNYGCFFLMPFVPFDWEEAEKLGATVEEFTTKLKNPFNLPEN